MSLRWKVLVLILTLSALLWPRRASAAPQLVITPASGPPTAEFVALLSDFVPGETIQLRITTTATAITALEIPMLRINSDGGYRLSITALLLPAGTYTVTALRTGTIVTSANFTITAARATPTSSAPRTTPIVAGTRPAIVTPTRGMPGLPTTGGGYAPTNAATATPWLLLGLLGLAPFIVIGKRHKRQSVRTSKE